MHHLLSIIVPVSTPPRLPAHCPEPCLLSRDGWRRPDAGWAPALVTLHIGEGYVESSLVRSFSQLLQAGSHGMDDYSFHDSAHVGHAVFVV
jgi:hypothetical protein